MPEYAMNSPHKLLFVYNANGGAFNLLADIGHKILSPATYACSLCSITHGIFKEKTQWKEFIATLPMDCIFLHRDEFLHQYPNHHEPLPAVYLSTAEGLVPCLSAHQLDNCQNMQDLIKQLTDSCTGVTKKCSTAS